MPEEPRGPEEFRPAEPAPERGDLPDASAEPRGPDDHRTSPRLSTTATVILAIAAFFIFAYVGFWVASRLL